MQDGGGESLVSMVFPEQNLAKLLNLAQCSRQPLLRRVAGIHRRKKSAARASSR
jgi:hypothetical protein